METKNNNPVHKRQGKDNDFKAQKKVFYEYLRNHLCTASMVSEATGIVQKNITRFKRDFEKVGKLWEAYEGRCKVTGFNAAYITTNENLVPEFPKQLNLFDDAEL